MTAHSRTRRARTPTIPPNSPLRIGRVQRQVRRAFIALGCPLTTSDLMMRAYPRGYDYSSWRYAEVRLAASRFAVRIGRSGRARADLGYGCRTRHDCDMTTKHQDNQPVNRQEQICNLLTSAHCCMKDTGPAPIVARLPSIIYISGCIYQEHIPCGLRPNRGKTPPVGIFLYGSPCSATCERTIALSLSRAPVPSALSWPSG